MPGNNVIETFLQNGGAKIQALDGTAKPAIVIGSMQKVESIEHLLEAPVTIEEKRKFDDLRGFISYISSYKGDNTKAFANRERIQVVFDYHGTDNTPKWCRHSVEFFYKRSQRWQLWERSNNQWMTQESFADFLDSGLQEITNPSQSAVLDAVKDFRATLNAQADSEITADGTHFSYSQTIKGGTKKTDITLPDFLTIQVSPYDGLHVLNDMIDEEANKIPTYSFRAKLSWRMKQSADASKPDFKVQLLNFDMAIDETLESVRNALQELTGVTTYIGG